jgi:hypothetical protein
MPWQTSTLGGVATPETADRLWLETRPSGRDLAGELLDSMGASQGQRLHSVSDHTYFDLVVDPSAVAIRQDRGLRVRCRGCFRSQILPSCWIQNLTCSGTSCDR